MRITQTTLGPWTSQRAAACLSLMVVGFSSLLTQVLLVRELSSSFYGNELFVAWILFAWLLWSGLSSLVWGGWLRKHEAKASMLWGLHLGLALVLPLTLVAGRLARLAAGPLTTLPDLPRSLLIAFLVPLPAITALTALFLTLARWLAEVYPDQTAGKAMGQAYMWETLGFVLGSAAFSGWFVFRDTLYIALWLQWAQIAAACGIYASASLSSIMRRVVTVIIVAIATFFAATHNALSTLTLHPLFPHQQIVAHRQTIYGPVTLTHMAGQWNLFAGGALVGSNAETEWNEELVHLTFLAHPEPHRVLLVGGGFTGALAEILKHGVRRVDYVEANPGLFRLTAAYIRKSRTDVFDDPRVQTIESDPPAFLNRLRRRGETNSYDVILLNLPAPSTLFMNRMFTLEAVSALKTLLRPGGILATHLPFAPDYLTPEQCALASTVYHTWRAVFDHVDFVAEYSLILLASNEPFSLDPQTLGARLTERRIQTEFVSPLFLEYRIRNDRNRLAREIFQQLPSDLNRNSKPRAVYYALIRWLALLHPRAARAIWAHAPSSPLWLLTLPVAAFVITRSRSPSSVKSITGPMGCASFSVMTLETAILFSFQIFYGYLHYRIAAVIGCLMLGMALGSHWGTRTRCAEARTVAVLHAAFLVCALLLAGTNSLATPQLSLGVNSLQVALLVLAGTAGFIGGAEFAINSRRYADSSSSLRHWGLVYSADLFGACLGALVLGLWLLPTWGLPMSLLALGAANAAVIFALPTRHSPEVATANR